MHIILNANNELKLVGVKLLYCQIGKFTHLNFPEYSDKNYTIATKELNEHYGNLIYYAKELIKSQLEGEIMKVSLFNAIYKLELKEVVKMIISTKRINKDSYDKRIRLKWKAIKLSDIDIPVTDYLYKEEGIIE